MLKQTAEAHHCDDARWTLARTDESSARQLAALLGVQYRRLASGEFNHSSTIELLDADGRIAARTGTLASVDPALLKALRAAMETTAATQVFAMPDTPDTPNPPEALTEKTAEVATTSHA